MQTIPSAASSLMSAPVVTIGPDALVEEVLALADAGGVQLRLFSTTAWPSAPMRAIAASRTVRERQSPSAHGTQVAHDVEAGILENTCSICTTTPAATIDDDGRVLGLELTKPAVQLLHRDIDGTRDVPCCKLARRTHVDQSGPGVDELVSFGTADVAPLHEYEVGCNEQRGDHEYGG